MTAGMNHREKSSIAIRSTFLAFVIVGVLCGITCVFFLSGERFLKFIGESAIKVISRMMGLILAVMGVQMIIAGIHGATKLSF